MWGKRWRVERRTGLGEDIYLRRNRGALPPLTLITITVDEMASKSIDDSCEGERAARLGHAPRDANEVRLQIRRHMQHTKRMIWIVRISSAAFHGD